MSDSGDHIFCHACGGVCPRNGSSLTCHHCESDFTEIIEIPPDTSPALDSATTVPNTDHPGLLHDTPYHPGNLWTVHNPWAYGETYSDGSSSGNNFRSRTYRSPDGRFTFSSTTYSQRFPRGHVDAPREVIEDPLMPMVHSLDTIFPGLADTYRQGGSRSAQRDLFPRQQRVHDQRTEDYYEQYGPGRSLYPHGAPPFGALSDLFELFRADFTTNVVPGSGVRIVTSPSPMAMLSTLLNFDHNGDAVYSQEELDRVISQLIDQNTNASAPPPASEEAIHSLPRRKVDQEMLGNEGKAECSICMEPVPLETEVAVLPCKHWFHYTCIELWLNQHNTCPHCRRGIVSQESQRDSAHSTATGNSSGETTSTSRRNRSSTDAMPDNSEHPSLSAQPPVSQTERDEGNSRRPSENNSGGRFASWVRSRFSGGY